MPYGGDVAGLIDTLTRRVDRDRLQRTLMAMLEVPSPSGQERQLSELYAELLRGAGLAVDLDYEFPQSPNVIGRLGGPRAGRTLQFDGHTDTISQEHPAPYCADG